LQPFVGGEGSCGRTANCNEAFFCVEIEVISALLRRLAIFGMAALFLCASPSSAAAKAPLVHGRAAVLIDGFTGQVLFQQNATDSNYPASTTKLLTALVALEHGNLNQKIKISETAVSQAPDSSSCYLNLGEEQRLEDLLYGLLLVSGNDCAVAIAEGVSGGRPEQFTKWMNETAKRLGASNSHFTNPHGLHEDRHYTTALDLALIAKAAFANPTLLAISGTREFNWPDKNNGTYYNHNSMLFSYDGTVGGKTGFTEEARLTLVNASQRDGRLLIGVVMGEDLKQTQYEDMRLLLNYGFEEFEQKQVVAAGSPQGTVPVTSGKQRAVPVSAGSPVLVTVPRGTEPKTMLSRILPASVQAPVKVGQRLGSLEVRDGERVVAVTDLTAQSDVAGSTPILRLLLRWAGMAVKWVSIAFAALLVFRTFVKIVRRLIRRSRRRAMGRQPARRRAGTVDELYRSGNR